MSLQKSKLLVILEKILSCYRSFRSGSERLVEMIMLFFRMIRSFSTVKRWESVKGVRCYVPRSSMNSRSQL